MKHKLLSLVALAGAMFMSTSVCAQSKWDAPVKPDLNEVNVENVQAGKVYYVKNVGAGQFLAGGGAWATQAVFTWTGMKDANREAIRVLVSDSTATIGGAKVTGYSLKLDGAFKTLGTSNRGAYSVANTYIFRDSEGSSFIDHGSQDKGYIWSITKAGNGFFRIQTAAGDPAFPNASTQYAGWQSANGPIEVEVDPETGEETLVGTPSTVITFDLTESTEGAAIDWMFIDPEVYLIALKVYDARKELYDALIYADEEGITGSVIDNATVVYNDKNATIEEMGKQKAHLLAAVAGKKYDFSGASEDNPLDVTEQVLENPTFDSNINGWTITVTGQNLQWQGRTDGKVDESKNWVSITNFIEAWTPSSGALGDGTISQTVYGLPKGKYLLECDAMATRQGGLNGQSAEDAVVGAYIFIEGDGEEIRNPIKAPDTQPKHWSVVFINNGSDWLTFGLKAESTTANWLSADNFKLTYYGETVMTQAQLELQEAINKAIELAADVNYDYSNANCRTIFEAAFESAEGIIADLSQDDAIYIAATERLSDAYDNLKTSIQVYAELADFISDTGKLAEYEALTAENGWDSLSEQLSAFHGTLDDVYLNGSYTNEQVTEAINSLKGRITTWLAEQISTGSDVIKEGTDLTILLDNPSFTEGTNGWTVTKDGGNTGTVSVDDGVDYREVEFWRSQFDISQTIANMPAGAYEITVQGFSRNEDDQENPNSDIKIELYAGSGKAQFMNLLDPTQVRPVDGNEPLWNGANPDRVFNIGGVEYYAPNGMGAASAYFAAENPQTGEPFYTNHVNVTLNEAGDFTIGVRSFNKSEWTLFDNFKITYRGNGGDIFAQMAEKKLDEVTKTYENDLHSTYLTTKTVTEYGALLEEDYTSISSIEEYTVFADKCDALIAYIKAETNLGTALQNLLADYESRYTYSEADLADFQSGIYTTMSEKLENKEFADNAELEAAPAKLAEAWADCILKDADTSMFSNATDIIYSPKYATYSDEPEATLAGWSMEKEEEVTLGNYRAANLVGEVFNPSGEYTHYQTLIGLKPGFYHVTVDAFFRPADPVEKTGRAAFAAISRAYMFGDSDVDYKTKTIKNIIEGAQSEEENPGYDNEMVYTWTDEGGEEYNEYVPNDVASAWGYFNEVFADAEPTPLEGEDLEQSVYRIAMDVEVGEEGELTIGISNVGFTDFVTNDWACFSNWTLSYLGTKAPVGIAVVDAKTEKAPAVIYTIDGRQASRLQRGLNIVRNADGNVQKVLVK